MNVEVQHGDHSENSSYLGIRSVYNSHSLK